MLCDNYDFKKLISCSCKRYLTNTYHCCKIGDSLSEWERIVAGVPQRSINGSILLTSL